MGSVQPRCSPCDSDEILSYQTSLLQQFQHLGGWPTSRCVNECISYRTAYILFGKLREALSDLSPKVKAKYFEKKIWHSKKCSCRKYIKKHPDIRHQKNCKASIDIGFLILITRVGLHGHPNHFWTFAIQDNLNVTSKEDANRESLTASGLRFCVAGYCCAVILCRL